MGIGLAVDTEEKFAVHKPENSEIRRHFDGKLNHESLQNELRNRLDYKPTWHINNIINYYIIIIQYNMDKYYWLYSVSAG